MTGTGHNSSAEPGVSTPDRNTPAPRRRTARRACQILLLASLLLVALANAVAFAHAWKMTHFGNGNARTPSPAKLDFPGKLRALALGVDCPRPKTRRTPAQCGFLADTHRIASTNGHTLEAWSIRREPTSGTIVLFHGYAAEKSDLLDAARLFHEMGFGCLLADFRGCGGSTGNTSTIGWEEADDVAAVVRHARDTLPGPIIVFAVSMGSAAALRAAATHDIAPAAMILESPFDSLITTTKCRFRLMGLPAFPFAHLLVFWGGVQHGFRAFSHNPADYAAHVDVPVLLLGGADDPLAQPEQIRRIAARLDGHSRAVFFPRAGHVPQYRANPRLWREAVAEFLAGAVPGRQPAPAPAPQELR